MRRRILILAAAVLVIGFPGVAQAADSQLPPAKRLPVAKVRFEQNATDGDVEVVFEITGPDEGLTKFTVVAPDGRTVVDFTAPDADKKFGIREFIFESPEPTDVESLKAAYPAGEYSFAGATAVGVEFRGSSSLSHKLPPTTSFLNPTERATGVEFKNLEIGWTPVENVTGYVVELEQAKLDMKLIVTLPASTTKFAVPAGLLVPGMKYQLGIGTVSASGNVSFIETVFSTVAE